MELKLEFPENDQAVQFLGESVIKYQRHGELGQKDLIKVRSSRDVVPFLRKLYGDQILVREAMFLLIMDQANQIVAYAKLSEGDIASCTFPMRLALKHLLNNLSSNCIVSHNHPSGQQRPSESDRQMTKKFKDACKLLDISVLDHIIVTDESYYSFADNGESSLS
jgi:DNA repair protein RadC